MKLTPQHTQAFISLLDMATSIAGQSASVQHGKNQLQAMNAQLEHHLSVLGIHAEMYRITLHAIVEKRVDVVERGFSQVLALYAEDSRDYKEEKKMLGKELFKTRDGYERASINQRISQIDALLTAIRESEDILNDKKNYVVFLIGGTPLPPSPSSGGAFPRLEY